MNQFMTIFIATAALALGGCASLMNAATGRIADNLSAAILKQPDPETVRAGAPAYLLLLDGLIEGNPDNPDLLLAGSKLNASYATAFVADPIRARLLADKSLAYAKSALCAELPGPCAALAARPADFVAALADTRRKHLPVLYGYATAWAGWIQVNRGDWNALAELPGLTALLERCVDLDERFDHGGAHLYLGVLASQLPPGLGGKPARGRAHFERALELSDGHNLMIKVLMAEHYARLVFDQALHDALLRSVLATPAVAPDFALINALAKRRAEFLLAESGEFF